MTGTILFVIGSTTFSVASTPTTSTPKTTGLGGLHSHTPTVSTGGSGTAVDRTPSYLATNVFIYLGL